MTRLDDSYSSWPLPSGSKHIRLFDIQPTPPNVPDQYAHPIQGELRVVDLEEQPSFTALSYVWGTYAGVPHIITCGEHNIQLKVTANCHSALLHLRAKLGGFSIWVDAVCINQHDKGEKSNQIPLIGNIYSAAETVYIWLGEGNIRTGRAMAYLATAGFLEYFDSTPLDKGQSTSRPWAAAFRAFLSTYSLKKHPFPFRGISLLF
ncbi:HET-domain-containing protein [Lojkania enalia]|uniref:HET-domain-containing protein n=1 Tax=Lojkania enalia TaxID=147567 RepID=A0A9P4NAT6_9PLEO|nr:HET-domain-containing protein [Didymosphaeria enalia]